nr:ATP-binding protein [Streptacidiphilus albus]
MGRLRHAVRAALKKWGLGEIGDITELCVSELVTNSVIHSKEPAGCLTLNVTVDRERGRLRVSVADTNPSAPQVREPMSDDEHGRGLLLVRALSAGWGVDHAPARSGKVVWCEIASR